MRICFTRIVINIDNHRKTLKKKHDYHGKTDWWHNDNDNLFWLVVYLHLWKIWKSIGMTIPNIWKKNKFQTTNQFFLGKIMRNIENHRKTLGTLTVFHGNLWDLPSGKRLNNELERSTICKMWRRNFQEQTVSLLEATAFYAKFQLGKLW